MWAYGRMWTAESRCWCGGGKTSRYRGLEEPCRHGDVEVWMHAVLEARYRRGDVKAWMYGESRCRRVDMEVRSSGGALQACRRGGTE